MTEMLVVEKDHGGIHIYGKYGMGGSITLTTDEAQTIQNRLEDILDG